MGLREAPRAIVEWFSRAAELRAARDDLPAPDADRERAAGQARCLIELARDVAEQTLPPPASPQAAALSLYRQAIAWAHVARRTDGAAASPPKPAEPGSPAIDAPDADVARARADVEDLLRDIERPRRRIERALIQRWSRLALLGGVALLVVAGARIVAFGPNLAAGRPLHLSSTWSGFKACVATDGCNGLILHTTTEDNPWVEVDLGAPRAVHRIEVFNRDNCCFGQATPLVAEVSTDRAAWTQVARSDRDFGSWKPTFPARITRYVRLRVPRRSTLHLASIAVR
jgi:hypothetical protein